MFAGKIHAVLCRGWKNRVKGRDLYDLVFFISRNTKINMTLLKNKLLESNYIDKNEKFNNYLYGTEFYEGNNTVQNNVEHPIQIFNRHLVLRLKIIRKYYIEPVYKYLTEQFMDSITKFWDNCNTLYIALLIILLIGLTGFYLLYWKPFEIKLDKDIYKTKNMLSIIPKEVIASLKNINTLLNLGTNTINSSSGGKDQIV